MYIHVALCTLNSCPFFLIVEDLRFQLTGNNSFKKTQISSSPIKSLFYYGIRNYKPGIFL